MKRLILSLTVLVFVASTTACFAHPGLDRVTGGLKDIVTSPLNISDNVQTEAKSAKFMPFGIVGGATKGTFYMGKQILDGTYTVVSTPYEMIKK
jgi:hypothetical protein